MLVSDRAVATPSHADATDKELPVTHFKWTPDLETGHAEIDAQHRGLFELANELHEAIAAERADDEVVADCVWQLTDYVVQHFADEEELMSGAAYPALSAHRALHQHLSAETMRITADYFNGEEVAPTALAPFVTGWLRGHIGDADRHFVTYLHARESGGASESRR